MYFAYEAVTLFGYPSHGILLYIFCEPGYLTVRLSHSHYHTYTTPVCLTCMCFGLQRFRSPLLTLSLRFLFLRLLRCFTSPGSPPFRDVVPSDYGLPHSGIHDSTAICSLSWLFAACHALLRYLLPRHPPNALTTLTIVRSRRLSPIFWNFIL